VSDRIYQAMLAAGDKQGTFAHGYTHSGHPVTAAVALETLRIYEEMDVVGHVRRVGAHLLAELAKSAEHPLVGDIRGVGLLCGVELVQDKAARSPYAPAGRVGGIIDRHARRRGLILRVVGDRVVFTPPLIIDQPEVDEMLRRWRGALDDTWAEVRREAA
jgi:4-aminobutyrate--pyruvate transaminase